MELKIGYWNLNKRNCNQIASYIVDLLQNENLDLLLVSEYDEIINDGFIESFLPDSYTVIEHGPVCNKVMVFQKKTLDFTAKTEDKRFIVLISKSLMCTIVGLHLKDNTNDGNASLDRMNDLSNIMSATQKIGFKKEIFVGDYNCMPYAEELAFSKGMHSVLFKKEMKDNNGAFPKHYNPMLLLLNETDEMYGSLRYTSSCSPLYWYAYDQVIVSEELMDSILEINYLKTINSKTLMSRCGMNPQISDHLPLVFKIKE